MRKRKGTIRKKTMAVMLVLAMLFSMIPASVSFAASSYDFQPEGADNTANSLKMIEPSKIELITSNSNYYLNEIQGEIDGTKDIKFTFTMSAGMNNFSESGFLQNNMPLIKIYDENEEKVLAEYSNGNGDLKFLGSHLTEEINNHGSKKTDELYIGVDQGVLSSGTYVIVFGRNICGNNTAKVLGSDIKFRFKVKAAPELSIMIQQAQDFLDGVKVDGTAPDTYPQAAADTLQSAIAAAQETLASLEEDTEMSEEEKKTANEQASDTLYKALQAFKDQRVVRVERITVEGVEKTVNVGDKGTASAVVSVNPDEDQYKKVVWSCSDNLMIDTNSGAWQANFSGDAWIKAVSKRDSSVSTTYNFAVAEEEGVVTVNLYDNEVRLQDMITRAYSGDASQITALKLFTSNNGELTSADLSYIKSTLSGLETLNLKNVSMTELPNSAFSGKASLKKIVLPDSLKIIQPRAFYNCSGLQDIELSAALTTIGSGAFAGCTSLPEQLMIRAVYPPSYAVSGSFGSAFNGTSSDPNTPVKSIQVPYGCSADYKSKDGWRSFGTITETDRVSLKVNFTASGTLADAAEKALRAAGVTENQVTDLIVTSPEGVQLSRADDVNGYLQTHFLYATTIDLSGTEFEDNKCNANTFKDRISLKHISLPESTVTIGGTCFYGCKNLREIILPESLGNIGSGAFGECNLAGTTVASNAEEPPEYSGTVFPDCVTTIVVPPQSVDAYKKAAGWSQYRDNIKSRITMTLSKSSLTLEVPATYKLTATPAVYGGDPDDVTVKWTSSNTSVAKVSAALGKSVTVSTLKPGTATITASDVTGHVTATCKVTVKAMAAPTVKAASYSYNAAKVTWSGVSGAAGYEVFRATSKTGSYTKIRTLTASARSYLDTGRSTGTTYYYKVRAYKTVNKTNYAGTYSAIVSAKPVPAKPTSVKTAKGGSKKIRVSWKKVSGASGYVVYRSTKKTTGYKAVKTIKSAKTVKYTTGKLKKGTTYYFKVRAYRTVKGKKVYGSYSAIVSRKAQ